MTKVCDHTSVGMILRQEDKVLLIERMKFPFGFAPPAGHVDGDESFEIAAKRELSEEVGLEAVDLSLVFEGKKDNVCKRQDGTWHQWKIYEVKVTGELKRSVDETKKAGWYSKSEIEALAEKTKLYLSGKISEKEWKRSPGLEVFWYNLNTEKNIF